MNPTVDELVAKAELLSVDEREMLLSRLRQTLPRAVDPGIEAAWIEEAERRMDAIERGEMKTVPWEDVRKHLGMK